jgi:hypothetical protein
MVLNPRFKSNLPFTRPSRNWRKDQPLEQK